MYRERYSWVCAGKNPKASAMQEQTCWGKLLIVVNVMMQHKKGQPAEDHPAVVELQKQLMTAVAETPEVQRLAEEAFRSFTRAYAAHPSSVKDVFHVRKLHLGHVAHSFALRWASHQDTGRCLKFGMCCGFSGQYIICKRPASSNSHIYTYIYRSKVLDQSQSPRVHL